MDLTLQYLEKNNMDLNKKIFVAGHRGLVGSAFVRKLKQIGANCIITKTRAELDLCNQEATKDFFAKEKPAYVILAAAKVGGIIANSTYPADFIYENMMIEANVIDAAYKNNCEKFLFLGSSCIYPKLCPQPIKEDYLLTSALEESNEAYALAKIAGIMLCKSYRKQYSFNAISAMPGNLYGPGDNFHPENSHVLPAMLLRMHDAKEKGLDSVTIWGTGKVLREFIHVDDVVDASIFLMNNYTGEKHVNIGSNEEVSIMELATLVASIVGYKGEIFTDPNKPDGTPRKVVDTSYINNLGWKAKISLKEGIKNTYKWFLEQDNIRK